MCGRFASLLPAEAIARLLHDPDLVGRRRSHSATLLRPAGMLLEAKVVAAGHRYSALPTSLAQTVEHMFVIFGAHPWHAITNIDIELIWG